MPAGAGTASTKAPEQEVVQAPVTAAAWKKAAVHPVVLPSGATVHIKVPDLARLIETGEIPQNLLDVALQTATTGRAPAPTPELAVRQREFTDMVVQRTVVAPKLSDEDVAEIPYEDKDMLVQIAMRERDLDAVGNHIGGLHKSEEFRRFRGLPSLVEALEDF